MVTVLIAAVLFYGLFRIIGKIPWWAWLILLLALLG